MVAAALSHAKKTPAGAPHRRLFATSWRRFGIGDAFRLGPAPRPMSLSAGGYNRNKRLFATAQS
jgi:hypothetical protein